MRFFTNDKTNKLMQIENILKKHKKNIHPIFKPELTRENTLIMDFSTSNPKLRSFDIEDVSKMTEYIFKEIETGNYLYGYGGYLENRDVYKRSPLFADGDEHRTIHLGVDIWVPADTDFYFPLDGQIHSFNNNSNTIHVFRLCKRSSSKATAKLLRLL